MMQVSLERIYEILQSYAVSDDVLRLHMENAERQATVEAQVLRIDELETELRKRLDDESETVDRDPPELEAVTADEDEGGG